MRNLKAFKFTLEKKLILISCRNINKAEITDCLIVYFLVCFGAAVFAVSFSFLTSAAATFFTVVGFLGLAVLTVMSCFFLLS